MKHQSLFRAVRTHYLPSLQQQHQSTPVISYPAYEPCNDKVAEFHQTKVKVRALFGDNRAGKTHAGAYELVSLARQYPGETFWACALSYEFGHISD